MDDILRKAKSIKDYIVENRRQFHRHPELAFKEAWTKNHIIEELTKLGLEYRILNKTGIISDIGDGDDRIGLRADMDALPITEETGLPYSSLTEGKMHACGHDTHMAMLLGAAKLIVENPVERPVRLIFQPSEERTPGGAPGMIEEGALDGVSEIFGLHIEPTVETGKIMLKSGPMMASADEFDIVLEGTGGHASEPNKTEDTVYGASLLINELQSIASRKNRPTSPFVLSICSIHGGNTYNIIPDKVKMKGTVRTVERETWQKSPEWMEGILEGVRTSTDLDYELRYTRGYPVLKNDEEKTQELIEFSESIVEGVEIMDAPIMGGEDFAYYLERRPGAFAFLGGMNEEKGIKSRLHTPDMVIDEDSMPYGTALLYRLANG